MRRVAISVNCSRCGTVGVLAEVDDLWPGLAIHPAHLHGVDGRVVAARTVTNTSTGVDQVVAGWVVTHVASGVSIPALFERREQAEWVLGQLGDLPGTDWTLPYEALQHEVVKVLMAGIIRQAGGAGLAGT